MRILVMLLCYSLLTLRGTEGKWRLCNFRKRGLSAGPRVLRPAPQLPAFLFFFFLSFFRFCLAAFSACAARASANSLNVMPWSGPPQVGPNGEPPSASDRLLWLFRKKSRLSAAFDAACTACKAAGALTAWEDFARSILLTFEAYGIGAKKIEQSAHECFDSLETLAWEVTQVVEQPGDAARAVQNKMVCFPFASAIC